MNLFKISVPTVKPRTNIKVGDDIESLLHCFHPEYLFSHIEGNPDDVIDTPDETKNYLITIEYTNDQLRFITGSFDKFGLPDDFAKATMEDWQKQVDEKLEELSSRYDAVYLIGHSMGTLFSLQRMNHPKIKALFLLAVPLSIYLKPGPLLAKTRYAIDIKNNPEHTPVDPMMGVEPDTKLWKYAKLLPNLHSLLIEIRRTKDFLKKERPKIPCVIYQSSKDEMVGHSAAKLLEETGFSVRWLKHSSHYVYAAEDAEILKQAFVQWIE